MVDGALELLTKQLIFGLKIEFWLLGEGSNEALDLFLEGFNLTGKACFTGSVGHCVVLGWLGLEELQG